MADVITPDGSVYRFDDGAGVWRHIPDVDTANAMGLDWNGLQGVDAPPGAVGDDWPSVDSGASYGPPPEPAPAPGEEPAPPPPPPPASSPGPISGDVVLTDGRVFRFDPGLGVWRHIPDVDTANAMGVDWNNLTQADSLPGNAGPDWPQITLSSPPLPGEFAIAPAPGTTPPPTPPPPIPAPSGAPSVTWGGRSWTSDDLPAFIAYLAAHGVDYSTWAANHQAAALVLEGPAVAPQREPMPKSLGEALVAYQQGGATPAEAAAQAEALREALVTQGVSAVTPTQLLQDSQAVAETLAAEQGKTLPPGQPAVSIAPPPSLRELQAVDPSQRELADASGLPPIPLGFKTISNGQVTEALVISAALIEHADPWVTIGTCKAESGMALEEGRNSAGATGPMQVVGYPAFSGQVELVAWAWGNLIAGARLIAKYGAVFDGDQQKMSAAYNAGLGAVSQHWPAVLQYLEVKGHPEDGTVQDYVDRVARFADAYRSRFAAGWNVDPQTGQLVGGSITAGQTGGPPPAEDLPQLIGSHWERLWRTLAQSSASARQLVESKGDEVVNIFR